MQTQTESIVANTIIPATKMPRFNTKTLTANFVLCALFVSATQFVGSIYLLSTSSCDGTVGSTKTEQVPAHTSSVHNLIPQPQEIRSLIKSTSPESSGNAIYTVDPEDALDCKSYLQDYRTGMIKEMERSPGWEKSYVTRTITTKPFYWSTHSPDLDTVRASSFGKGQYYESKLSDRVQEAFDAKNAEGKESIFLDVGGNIGWFSLLAAAHGATKVYTFEPNPANLVRLCESLSLNDWLRDDRSKDTVMPIAKGVGDKVSTQKLYRSDENNPGSYSFSKERAVEQFKKGNNKEKRRYTTEEKQKYLDTEAGVVGEIDLITLDSFAESRGWFESKPSIAFFKLDVEGFEMPIIQGAKKLFKSRLVELFDMEMKPNTPIKEKHAMLEVIFNSGYELYMQGWFKGPNNKVERKYTNYLDLAADITARKYGENLLFRRREDWIE